MAKRQKLELSLRHSPEALKAFERVENQPLRRTSLFIEFPYSIIAPIALQRLQSNLLGYFQETINVVEDPKIERLMDLIPDTGKSMVVFSYNGTHPGRFFKIERVQEIIATHLSDILRMLMSPTTVMPAEIEVRLLFQQDNG